jgi:hypothetical protein
VQGQREEFIAKLNAKKAMPTVDADSNVTENRLCPLCDAPLEPGNPNECIKCDWTLGYRRRKPAALATQRDMAAMLLSVVPGLGHIYKGHPVLGVLLMAGGCFAILACSVAATATMGLGLLLIPIYWAGVMMHGFWLEDRRAVAGRLG